MITDAISRIEQVENIENVALNHHVPSNGTYIIVDKDFNYKIISKERFCFNSKYIAMDFYSKIIELNKAVDKKKLITSNNYLTFFCKNFDKLNSDTIDNYYNVIETPEECLVYREWIKENIFKISSSIDTKDVVKVFFIEDIEEYICLGKKYMEAKILSNEVNINGEKYGTSVFLNLNSKKPYLKNLTNQLEIPSIITIDEAIKYKYFQDILFSFAKQGYDLLYILETGKMIPINIKQGGMPKYDFVNAMIFVYKVDNRGKLIILDMDLVPKYSANLNVNLENVLSVKEAADMWGLEDDSTIRKAIANDRFYEHEYRKTGRNYIIAKSAMERVYGKLNKE